MAVLGHKGNHSITQHWAMQEIAFPFALAAVTSIMSTKKTDEEM